MATKEEISNQINETFPLDEDIDWSKLSKEDLLLIKPLLTDPKGYVKKYAMDKGEERVADLILILKQGLEERKETEEGLKFGEGKIINKIINSI